MLPLRPVGNLGNYEEKADERHHSVIITTWESWVFLHMGHVCNMFTHSMKVVFIAD